MLWRRKNSIFTSDDIIQTNYRDSSRLKRYILFWRILTYTRRDENLLSDYLFFRHLFASLFNPRHINSCMFRSQLSAISLQLHLLAKS